MEKKDKMKIGIVGTEYVGHSNGILLSKHNKVVSFEQFKKISDVIYK